MKEERLAILRMLEKGNISVDEAERLLNAVNNTNDKDISETINNALGKAGSLLEKFGKKAGEVAKTVSQKAEEKYPEVKKTAKNVVNKMNDAAETIKQNIDKAANEDIFEGEATEKTEDTEETNEAKPEDFVDDVKIMPVENEAKEDKEEKQEEEKAEDKIPEGTHVSDLTSDKPEKEYVEEFADSTNNEEDEEDDGRDYEGEFYHMMQESNGDIYGFGDVYKAMDDLNTLKKMPAWTPDSDEKNDETENK